MKRLALISVLCLLPGLLAGCGSTARADAAPDRCLEVELGARGLVHGQVVYDVIRLRPTAGTSVTDIHGRVVISLAEDELDVRDRAALAGHWNVVVEADYSEDRSCLELRSVNFSPDPRYRATLVGGCLDRPGTFLMELHPLAGR